VPKNSRAKTKAYKLGLRAEKIAVIFLRLKGYRIIAQRYRNHKGEIDILAVKGKILAVVEVKARRSLSECSYSITPWKQQKILGAIECLTSSHNRIAALAKAGERMIRFDVIWVLPMCLPKHLKDAWRM
jgi:putative endonuclease